MGTIEEQYSNKVSVHLFSAIPNSIAIEIGRIYLPKAWPDFIVYDFDKDNGGYTPILTI